MRPQLVRHVTVALATVAVVGATAAMAAASPGHQPGPDCDPLVTYTTDGVQGDALAVAITSQSLEADVPGWGHISWQAAPTTVVSAVIVTGADGTTRIDGGDLVTGTVTEVLAVTFCGTVGAPDTDQDDQTDGAAADEAVVVAGGGDHSPAAGGAATETETARAPAVDTGSVAPAPVDTSPAGLRAAGVEVDSLLTPVTTAGEAVAPAPTAEHAAPGAGAIDAAPATHVATDTGRTHRTMQPETALALLTGALAIVVAVEFTRRRRQLVEVRR